MISTNEMLLFGFSISNNNYSALDFHFKFVDAQELLEAVWSIAIQLTYAPDY